MGTRVPVGVADSTPKSTVASGTAGCSCVRSPWPPPCCANDTTGTATRTAQRAETSQCFTRMLSLPFLRGIGDRTETVYVPNGARIPPMPWPKIPHHRVEENHLDFPLDRGCWSHCRLLRRPHNGTYQVSMVLATCPKTYPWRKRLGCQSLL